MKALMINDLVRSESLDSKALASVHGGTGMYKGGYLMPSFVDASKHSFSFDASQSIGQSQETLVNNGNNVAFASGITANVKPAQTANNTINFG